MAIIASRQSHPRIGLHSRYQSRKRKREDLALVSRVRSRDKEHLHLSSNLLKSQIKISTGDRKSVMILRADAGSTIAHSILNLRI
jgi:hypothetical protein